MARAADLVRTWDSCSHSASRVGGVPACHVGGVYPLNMRPLNIQCRPVFPSPQKHNMSVAGADGSVDVIAGDYLEHRVRPHDGISVFICCVLRFIYPSLLSRITAAVVRVNRVECA